MFVSPGNAEVSAASGRRGVGAQTVAAPRSMYLLRATSQIATVLLLGLALS